MATNMTNRGEWHTFQCGGHQLTVPIRYQDPVLIGQGAFGAVIRATDTETEKYVAIKKMLFPFTTPEHAKRTYRELKLLMYLNHPDAQVIQLYNVFTPERSLNEFKTLYFVFNFAGFNLHQVIHRQRPFAEDHIKLIMYSLLRGLKFMHSAGIIHRDLKPTNIGIDENSDVTILDFGLARVLSDDDYTIYVATRWWRAPEVYIDEKHYREKIDIWSVGCIMAELIVLHPIFPGTDKMDQLKRIFDILGTPNTATLNQICIPETISCLSHLPSRSGQDFNQLFGFKYDPTVEAPISGVSPQGVNLLTRLLSFDHRERPTAEEALAHPFFEPLHDPMEEPTTEPIFDENEGAQHTVATWKSIVWQMVEEFIPPSWVANDLSED